MASDSDKTPPLTNANRRGTAAVAENHPSRSELSEFVAGRLRDEQVCQRIEAHLASCQTCCRHASMGAPDHFERQLSRSAQDLPASANVRSLRLGPAYELFEVLGQGGAGIVYRARQAGLDRDVALKKLWGGATSSPEHLARFRHESLALSRLQHPHIVEIYDLGEQDGDPFLVMELVRGQSLAERLRSGPLEVHRAVELTIQMADAIVCAHDHGILHRDLKPQNVLLREGDSWHAKLADFGLSCLHNAGASITKTGDPLGTPSYMAPEMVQGVKHTSTQGCDVYGLGAILYECLVGRPPFRGASAVETMDMVLHREPVPLRQIRSGVPADLETICHCALEKDVSRRYPTAAALRHDLTEFLNHRPIVARPRGLAYRARLWIRRNPWPTAWLSTIAVAALAGLLFLVGHQRRIAEERDRANDQYRMARATIWSILGAANRTTSFEVPKLAELSIQQAQSAITLFEQLAAESQSADARLDLARIRMHLGTLLVGMGRTAEGEELLALASRAFREYIADADGPSADFDDWLTSQAKLGGTWVDQGRYQAARQILEPAVQVAEEIQRAHPNDYVALDRVAWLYHQLGYVYFHEGNLEAMKHAYQQAVALRERGIELAPGHEHLILRLTEARVNLAQAELQSGNIDLSLREFQSAIDILDAPPKSPQFTMERHISRAAARLNISNVHASREDYVSAIDSCTRGIEDVETVLAVEPNHAAARELCYQLYGNRALFRCNFDEPETAVLDWQAAIEVPAPEAVIPYLKTMKIRCLVQGRRLDKAEHEARQLQSTELLPADQFRLAAAWGMLGNALEEQLQAHASKQPQVDLESRCNDARRQAGQLVQQLHREGHFQHDAFARQYFHESDDFGDIRQHMAVDDPPADEAHQVEAINASDD